MKEWFDRNFGLIVVVAFLIVIGIAVVGGIYSNDLDSRIDYVCREQGYDGGKHDAGLDLCYTEEIIRLCSVMENCGG